MFTANHLKTEWLKTTDIYSMGQDWLWVPLRPQSSASRLTHIVVGRSNPTLYPRDDVMRRWVSRSPTSFLCTRTWAHTHTHAEYVLVHTTHGSSYDCPVMCSCHLAIQS